MLCTGPYTGHTELVYWGPGISLRFFQDVLLLVPGGLGLHHDTSVVCRMCVYKKYVACPLVTTHFLLMLATSSCFLSVFVSLLLPFKHFTTCQGLLQPP